MKHTLDPSPSLPGIPSGATHRVLLAEDDDALAAVLVEALSRRGWAVDRVSDGAALLDLLAAPQDEQPDIVLSDVRMKGRSGLDVLASMRRSRPPPVVVMTGFMDDAIARQALSLGAAAVLAKPVDLDVVSAVLETVERASRR
ncbi:MAG: response regulator [Sandaracinaceae bacterium]|nr:response regulator [Sandaracinaceae bacterium]